MRTVSAIFIAAAALSLAAGEASAGTVPVRACLPHYEYGATWNYYGEHLLVTYYIDASCGRTIVRSRPFNSRSPIATQR